MKERLNRLVILLLLLLFSFSQLYLIRASIGCTVGALFPLWLAAICLCNWLSTCFKRGPWIGLPLAALLLFAAYRCYQADLVSQVNDLFDRITGVYYEQVAYPGDTYDYLNAAADHSLLFVFVGFLFSSYMSSAITARSGRLLLAMLGGLPFTLACLAVELHPPIWTVVGILLFFFLLAAGGGHYADESNCYLAAFYSLLPIALLLGALLLLVRPSSYQYDPSQVRLNQRLSELSRAVDEWISERAESIVLPYSERLPEQEAQQDLFPGLQRYSGALWQDPDSGIDLTKALDPEDLDTLFLRVRSERTGSLYLRSVSYGDYTGTGWLAAKDYSGASSLPYTALALASSGAETQALSIKVLEASPYRFVPYFSTQAGDSDVSLPSEDQSEYVALYLPFPASFDALRLPEDYASEELAYRAFAQEYYTRLPDSTRRTLRALCDENGLSPGMDGLIESIARYVQRSAVYDPETAPYPTDDCAVYFLTRAESGYCVHYATAAAALYRCLGVPARVAEGFLIDCEAGKSLDVKGEDAHAWVEIYRDGLGWLPVEVTGQSGLDTGALGSSSETPTPTTQPAEPEPSAQTAEAGPAEPRPLTPTPAPTGEMSVGLVTQSTLDEREAAAQSTARGLPFWLLTLVLTAVLALPLWRWLRKTLRYRSFEQADTGRAAVAVYRTALSASAFGAPIPAGIRVCAEKAAFSRHPVSREELERSRDELYIMLKSLYLRLKPWKKFQFKYLCAFL